MSDIFRTKFDMALEAEQLRRSHCAHDDKNGDPHKCHGKVTIAPGLLMLDCGLCGHTCINTVDAITYLDGKESE